jgi:regulator of protease activity HflC (stomatin/prohibitin superfamily)
MGDFLKLFLDSIQYLWPLRRVEQWENGAYYIGGRYWKTVGPGIWPIVPWFTEVKSRSVVPGIVRANRQDIGLKDGTWLSFSASAVMRITDLAFALNSIDQYEETAQETLEAVLADKLSQVDADRLAPEKRGRLLADLTRWVNEEVSPFGIEVQKVRFVTFIHKPRIFRLLGDTQAYNSW